MSTDARMYPQGRGAVQARYIKDTLVEFGIVKALRARLTLAQVNATGGAALLAALPGVAWQVLDWTMISIGGAAGGATSLNISGTRAGSAVHLAVTAVAALTRSAVVRAGAANAVVLADGASFTALDANTPVVCQAIAAGSMTTATHFDVTIIYVATAP